MNGSVSVVVSGTDQAHQLYIIHTIMAGQIRVLGGTKTMDLLAVLVATVG